MFPIVLVVVLRPRFGIEAALPDANSYPFDALMRAQVKSLDRSSQFLYTHPNPPMKRAIDCSAVYSYSTVVFNVLPEMTNWDYLVSEEGVQNKQITDGLHPSQG